MAYTALYNKYRPKTFEQVAGQQAIVRTLRNALNNSKIAHAYLFCGPRGTGKTSMARLFAKALNCEEGLGHQCNECENCRQLNENAHPDVVEIDAASNNGVEQVRDLIDQVRYSPIKGRTKVYIIDEVHMMSSGAFNALLKTLEEPPNHVVFILATTEPHKVLPTILSRCQRYDFEKISPSDMKEKLVWILKQENIHYEDKALDELVELADGGMRDSLSLLDQALAYGGNQLLEKDVLAVFGLASTKEKIELIRLITTGEVGDVLAKLAQFLDAGLDVKRLCSSLLDILKDELIYRRTGKTTYAKSLNLAEAEELSHFVDSARANDLINILLKAQVDFKSVSNIRSLFELTLLQMTTLFGSDKKDVIVTPITPYEPIPQPAPQPVKKEIVVEKKPIVEEPKPEPVPEPAPIVEEVAQEEAAQEEVVVEPVKEDVVEPEPEPQVQPQPEPIRVVPERHAYDPFHDGVYTGSEPPSFLFQEEGVPFEKPKIQSKIHAERQEIAQNEPIPEPEDNVQLDEPVVDEVVQESVSPEPAPAPEPEPVLAEPEPKPQPEPVSLVEPESAPRVAPKPEPKVVPPEPKPTPVTPVTPAPAPKPAPEQNFPKIDTAMIFNASLSIEGTPLPVSDETVVDIMVLGGKYKEFRKQLFAKWGVFETLMYDPKVGEAATLLSKGKPFCLCEEALLINFPFADQAYRANLRENQRVLRQLVGQLLGREVFIHGLDRNDSSRCQNMYYSKLQLHNLPDPSKIVLNLPK